MATVASPLFTDTQLAQFENYGYVELGKVLRDDQLTALQNRIDEIMLGQANVPYDRMLMQLDSSTGKYEDVGEQTKGFKRATLEYRKIQDLEYDPFFLRYIQHPLFRDICARILGPTTPVSVFRAMFMNKPAQRGTWLPWHQDRWNALDRDPLITVWTALDPATIENGCVQIVPGSHHYGVINPSHHSGHMTEQQISRYVVPGKTEIHFLQLEPGEAVLLHNWLLHASDVNRSPISRRAFSVCYMDAATRTHDGERFPVVFGEGSLQLEESE